MRLVRAFVFAAALHASAPAYAQTAQPPPSEIRLSDEEKEKVLEAAASDGKRPIGPRHDDVEPGPAPKQVHGEVGFTIGTGGYRSAYGTAVVPLQGDGLAIISFHSTDFGKRGGVVEPWWR